MILDSKIKYVSSKEKLIKQANKNDISSMIDLNKYNNFIHTKDGLAHFKKWYPIVLNSKDTKEILSFANIIMENHDLFINGKLKYLTLLESAKEKGNKEASFELLKYYNDNMIGNEYFKRKFTQTKDEILKDQSKENLLKLRNTFYKIHERELARKVTLILEEKKYINTSLQNTDELNEAYRKSQYIGYDKKRLPNIINKIIASKSLDDILYASNKIKHREHEFREKLLNTALELTNDKKIKGKIYFNLADNQKRLREHLYEIKKYYQKELKKEKDSNEINKIKKKIANFDKDINKITNATYIKLYEKAASYDNLGALKKLYFYYLKDMGKYSEKYHKTVIQLKQSDKGLKFYIKENPYSHNIKLFEKLAKKGDKDIIVRLAKQNLNDEQAGLENIARKNRNYILQSNDYKLHLKMKKVLNSYDYKYSEKAKKFLAKLEKKEQNWENIYLLREKIKETRDRELELKYLELAYSYGDIKSALKLAKRRVAWGYDWKYENNKEQARQEVQKGLKIFEEFAKQDDKQALAKLADIYSLKSFMGKEVYDLEKALKYYERLGELGDNFYLEKAIKIYKCKTCGFYDEEKLANKLKLYLEKKFDTRNAHELGMLYYKKGKLQDLKKAEKYFKMSKSNYYLARLYYDKNGLGLDGKKAYSYLKKCAFLDGGKAKCNHLMGMFYKDGFGVKKDEKKAVSYFYSASYDNYMNPPQAALELTKIYEKHKMYKESATVFIRVAKYYKKQALENLERLYKKGHVSKKDLKSLHLHFLQTYKLRWSKYDEKNSALFLSYMYEMGLGVKKDLEKAKQWRNKPSQFAY